MDKFPWMEERMKGKAQKYGLPRGLLHMRGESLFPAPCPRCNAYLFTGGGLCSHCEDDLKADGVQVMYVRARRSCRYICRTVPKSQKRKKQGMEKADAV